MSYAVFEDDQKLSRSFSTKQEALQKADQAGLIDRESHGKPVLEDGLSIEACSPDSDDASNADLDWSLEKRPSAGREDVHVDGVKEENGTDAHSSALRPR
jgi:hypothetical protein